MERQIIILAPLPKGANIPELTEEIAKALRRGACVVKTSLGAKNDKLVAAQLRNIAGNLSITFTG